MSSTKKIMLRNILREIGCGCGKPKPRDIIEPKPNTKTAIDDQKPSDLRLSSSSSWEEDSTFSFNIDASPHCFENGNDSFRLKMISPSPKLCNSTAVMKDSDDPYHDFRQSMLQMIFEKEIHSKDDLQELLDCFLQLNSPSHHDTIVKAFMEIWNGVVSKSPISKKKKKPPVVKGHKMRPRSVARANRHVKALNSP